MKEVIILGKGNSRDKCPFDAEVWGINDVYKMPEVKGKRIDKLFSFDDWSKSYTDKQKKVATLVSWRNYATENYPLEEIIKHFNTEYFNNTAAYMIALAIYLKYDKIRLYGIDHPIGSPWFEDRTGVEYWLGRAEEAGIKVEVAEGSQVLRTLTGKLYGQAGDSNITLYLYERAAILSLVPKTGNSQNARIIMPLLFKIGFTEEIIKTQGITMQHNQQTGQVSLNYKAELAEDFIFTPEEFTLIKEALVALDKKEKLPVHYMSLWEKFARHPHELKGGQQWLSRSVIAGSAV